METKNTKFYGAIAGFNEEKKTVEAIILHFDTPNENFWMAKSGCLNDFLERLKAANKGVAACYQHDDKILIGKWDNFRTEGQAFMGTLQLSDIPFVNETVIPQLKDGTLQGSSPTIGSNSGMWDNETGVFAIVDGVICEISLVGLPADLEANITKISAKIEAHKKNNFDVDLLTL